MRTRSDSPRPPPPPPLPSPPELENLSLRQNLVADATPLCGMANVAGFKRVVLHDNHLKALPPLEGFPALEVRP